MDFVKVLVTGATGFLGGWVTRALLRAGHSVRAFVRRPDRLKESGFPRVEPFQGDILLPDSLSAAMSNVDAVIHCAGSVSMNPRDRAAVNAANIQGARNVFEAAFRGSLRVLHTSSIACIGPTLEPQVLDESTPGAPLNFACPYADSKRESERLAFSYAAKGLDVIVLNPGIVLGPGDPNYSSTELVLRYLRGELRMYPRGGGSFCDARDIAEAYVSALGRARSGSRYILAGVNRTYREVTEDLERLTGLHPCRPLPRGVAETAAFWSEVGSVFLRHPFENLNQATVRWGSLFNYCSAAKAQRDLDYRVRRFSETLADTVADHVQRGAARPATVRLRSLLARAPSISG